MISIRFLYFSQDAKMELDSYQPLILGILVRSTTLVEHGDLSNTNFTYATPQLHSAICREYRKFYVQSHAHAVLILFQPHRRISLHEIQINLMPQQLPNILHPVLNHRRSLQTQPPSINPHILRQPHRLQHLRSKHTTITNLNPLIQPLMKAKNLHTRFRIRIICRLEAQFMNPHFRKKYLHEADEATKSEAIIGDDAFDLVEFREMSGVDGFVAKDAVDGEVADGVGFGGEGVEHGRGDGGGVGAEDEAEGF